MIRSKSLSLVNSRLNVHSQISQGLKIELGNNTVTKNVFPLFDIISISNTYLRNKSREYFFWETRIIFPIKLRWNYFKIIMVNFFSTNVNRKKKKKKYKIPINENNQKIKTQKFINYPKSSLRFRNQFI